MMVGKRQATWELSSKYDKTMPGGISLFYRSTKKSTVAYLPFTLLNAFFLLKKYNIVNLTLSILYTLTMTTRKSVWSFYNLIINNLVTFFSLNLLQLILSILIKNAIKISKSLMHSLITSPVQNFSLLNNFYLSGYVINKNTS